MINDIDIGLKNGGRIKIRYAREDVSPETYFDHLHEHDCCEICMIKSGSMLHIANGKAYTLRRGDVFFSRPGELHYAFCHETSVYERYALWLPREIFSEPQGDALGFLFMPALAAANLFRVREGRCDEMFAMLDKLRPYLSAEQPDKLTAYGITAGIISFLSTEAEAYVGSRPEELLPSNIPPIVNRAILYIRENYRQPGGVKYIADSFHMNCDYLSRVFRRYTGQTLHEYLVNVRIRESRIMLKRGCGVTETAFACGFNSTSYFIKVFFAAVGQTPAAFRRSGKQFVYKTEQKS